MNKIQNRSLLRRAENGDPQAQAEMAQKCIISHDTDGAWKWANLSSEQKNPDGLYALGMCYMSGYGTEINLSKAWNIFKESIETGCTRAYTGLAGVLTFKGEPFGKESREYIKIAADANDSKGLYLLSLLYKDGLGVIRSKKRSVELLIMSSKQDFAPAMFDLAMEYLDDEWQGKLQERGIELLKKAAGQGFAKAEAFLGYLTLEGKGMDKDEHKAFEMFENAASKGNKEAMRSLGFCYMRGQGVAEDKEKSSEWFKRAYEAGCDDCREWAEITEGDLDKLKEMLKGGGIKEDFEFKAKVEKGAKEKNPEALYELAYFYLTGKAGEILTHDRDDKKGIRLLKEAAHLGNSKAAFDLGCIHKNGNAGVTPDATKSFQWFEKAAEMGNVKAMVNLGITLNFRNQYNESHKWLEKAAETGDPTAMGILSIDYAYGHSLSMDETKALQLARESAQGGCPIGNWIQGAIYFYGNQVPRDKEKGLQFLTLAANQEEIHAIVLMGRILMGEFGDEYLDLELAEELLLRATKRNVCDAFYFLGVLYVNFFGEEKRGIKCLTIAAQMGSQAAIDFLNQMRGHTVNAK